MAALIGTVPAVGSRRRAIAVAGLWMVLFPQLRKVRHLDGETVFNAGSRPSLAPALNGDLNGCQKIGRGIDGVSEPARNRSRLRPGQSETIS